MATVDKKLAEQLMERVKKQKRPQIYCILYYWNSNFGKDSYAYCNNEVQYQAILNSPAVSCVKILWASDRFNDPDKRKKEVAKAKETEELREALGL